MTTAQKFDMILERFDSLESRISALEDASKKKKSVSKEEPKKSAEKTAEKKKTLKDFEPAKSNGEYFWNGSKELGVGYKTRMNEWIAYNVGLKFWNGYFYDGKKRVYIFKDGNPLKEAAEKAQAEFRKKYKYTAKN